MSYPAGYYRRYSHYLKINLADVPLFARISAKCEKLGRGRLIDVGCGLGYLLSWLGRQGWHGVGIDGSIAALGMGRESYPESRLACASVYQLPFAGCSFDVALAVNVVEHLERPRDLLMEMARVLKPGGTLIVSTPEARSLYNRLFIHDSTHVHEFTKEEIVGLLSEQGTIVDVALTNSVGRLGRSLNALAARLLPCDILVEARKPAFP